MYSLSKITANAKHAIQEFFSTEGVGLLELPVGLKDSQLEEFVDAELDTLKSQHSEVSRTLRRSIYLHLGFASYCLLALGAPDRSLLAAQDSIALPIINAKVSYTGFLFFAPLVLIAMTAHVHIFLKLLKRIEARSRLITQKYKPNSAKELTEFNKYPAIFNLNSSASKVITNFLYYWLTPFAIGGFYIKSLPRPEPEPMILLTLTGVCAIWMIVLGTSQLQRVASCTKAGLLSLLITAIVVFLFVDIASRYINLKGIYSRPVRALHLYNANLSGLDLRAYGFREADLRKADLSGADLRGVNLESADLTGTNFAGALLNDANLDESILVETNLQDTDLSNAKIRRTRLIKVNMRNAILHDTDFSETDMRRTKDIVAIQLKAACGDGSTRMPLTFDQPFELEQDEDLELEQDKDLNLADCSKNPSRDSIRKHYIHLNDTELAQTGRYWSNRDQILDIEELLVRSDKYEHLLLYFDSSLDSTSASARKIAAMKDVFKGNLVYPVFFIIGSGMLEHTREILIGNKSQRRDSSSTKEDASPQSRKKKAANTMREMSFFRKTSMKKVGASDWTDKVLETVVRQNPSVYWKEMKNSAKEVFENGNPGFEIMSMLANSVKKHKRKLVVHAIGEGIGAIYLNEMLVVAKKLDIKLSSITLIAPALTIDLFRKNVLPLLHSSADKFGIDRISIYVLPDKLEKDDNVSKIYRKSMLYLISEALESKKEMPLLGMEKYKGDIPSEQVDYIISQNNKTRSQSTRHAGFSNDPVTMNDILRNILGHQPSPLFVDSKGTVKLSTLSDDLHEN